MTQVVRGRLVFADRVVPGRVLVDDGRVAAVELDGSEVAAFVRRASLTSTSTAGRARGHGRTVDPDGNGPDALLARGATFFRRRR